MDPQYVASLDFRIMLEGLEIESAVPHVTEVSVEQANGDRAMHVPVWFPHRLNTVFVPGRFREVRQVSLSEEGIVFHCDTESPVETAKVLLRYFARSAPADPPG